MHNLKDAIDALVRLRDRSEFSGKTLLEIAKLVKRARLDPSWHRKYKSYDVTYDDCRAADMYLSGTNADNDHGGDVCKEDWQYEDEYTAKIVDLIDVCIAAAINTNLGKDCEIADARVALDAAFPCDQRFEPGGLSISPSLKGFIRALGVILGRCHRAIDTMRPF